MTGVVHLRLPVSTLFRQTPISTGKSCEPTRNEIARQDDIVPQPGVLFVWRCGRELMVLDVLPAGMPMEKPHTKPLAPRAF